MSKRDRRLSPEEVIERARTRIDDARHSLDTFRSTPRPPDKLRAFRYAVSSCRDVTFALQRMKSAQGVGDRWEAWYAIYQDQMRKDPLLKSFVDLRNHFEKQGGMSPGPISISLGRLDTRDINRYFLPPRGEASFFIGDHLGRSGWIVYLPNGKKTYRYVDLPRHWEVEIAFTMADPPETHLGNDVSGRPLDELLEMNISYLESVVLDAEEEFTG